MKTDYRDHLHMRSRGFLPTVPDRSWYLFNFWSRVPWDFSCRKETRLCLPLRQRIRSHQRSKPAKMQVAFLTWKLSSSTHTLPETKSSHLNGWLEYDRVLLGWPIFRGELLVSGIVIYQILSNYQIFKTKKMWWFNRLTGRIRIRNHLIQVLVREVGSKHQKLKNSG